MRSHLASRICGACVLLLFLVFPGSSLFAQESLTIGTIKVTGQKRFTVEQIAAASGLRIGQPFRPSVLDDAVNRLGDTGAFESARYGYRMQGGQVIVDLIVEESARFHRCVFDNFVWFPEAELLNHLKKNIPLFDGWVPETGKMADAVTTSLMQLLRKRGIGGDVSQVRYGALGDQSWIYLYTVGGASANVTAIDFKGATTVDLAALQKEASPLLKRNFSFVEFQAYAGATFLPFFRDRGYLRIKIGDPIAEPVAPSECASTCQVKVTYPVVEGLAYKWKSAEWVGDLLKSAPELDKILGMKTAEVADASKIEKGLADIRKEYRKRGFLEALVNGKSVFDDAASTVTYRMDIHKGPQYHMGRLLISGFSPKTEVRIQDKWRLKSGDIFDGLYPGDFVRKDLPAIMQSSEKRILQFEVKEQPDKQSLAVDVTLLAR